MGFILNLGIEFVAPLLVGVLIGRQVDFYFNSHPWGLVILIIFATMAGMLNVYRAVRKLSKF